MENRFSGIQIAYLCLEVGVWVSNERNHNIVAPVRKMTITTSSTSADWRNLPEVALRNVLRHLTPMLAAHAERDTDAELPTSDYPLRIERLALHTLALAVPSWQDVIRPVFWSLLAVSGNRSHWRFSADGRVRVSWHQLVTSQQQPHAQQDDMAVPLRLVRSLVLDASMIVREPELPKAMLQHQMPQLGALAIISDEPDGVTLDILANVLGSKALRKLACPVDFRASSNDDLASIINLAHMAELDITASAGIPDPALFSRLSATAPCLHRFCISSSENEVDGPAVAAILAVPTLEEATFGFDVRDHQHRSIGVWKLLQPLTTSVTTLRIPTGHFTDLFGAASDAPSGLWAPNLTRLELADSWRHENQPATFNGARIPNLRHFTNERSPGAGDWIGTLARLPHLRTLNTLVGSWDTDGDYKSGHMAGFARDPTAFSRLRTLRVMGAKAVDAMRALALPCLDTLEVHAVGADDLTVAALPWPQLQSLALRAALVRTITLADDVESSGAAWSSPDHLPHLQSLEFDGTAGVAAPLRLPALERLNLGTSRTLSAFDQATCPNLKHLTVQSGALPTELPISLAPLETVDVQSIPATAVAALMAQARALRRCAWTGIVTASRKDTATVTLTYRAGDAANQRLWTALGASRVAGFAVGGIRNTVRVNIDLDDSVVVEGAVATVAQGLWVLAGGHELEEDEDDEDRVSEWEMRVEVGVSGHHDSAQVVSLLAASVHGDQLRLEDWEVVEVATGTSASQR
ncbi:hypothetical protein BC828DRAFT_264115 [Blastocladiella britannica]|nr:hypothetical protein BC828DRAFT_264115 [Blastocladiella britannica]